MAKLPWFTLSVKLEENTYYSSAWTGIKTPEEKIEDAWLSATEKVIAENIDAEALNKAVSDVAIFGRGTFHISDGDMDTRLRGYDAPAAFTCSGCIYFALGREVDYCHRPKELEGNENGYLPVNGDRCEHYRKDDRDEV